MEGSTAADKNSSLERRWEVWRLNSVQEKHRGCERTALRESHHGVVGPGPGDVVKQPFPGCLDVLERFLLPEGIVWWIVKEVYAGGWGGWYRTVYEVEVDIERGQVVAEGCWCGLSDIHRSAIDVAKLFSLTGLCFKNKSAGAFSMKTEDSHSGLYCFLPLCEAYCVLQAVFS